MHSYKNYALTARKETGFILRQARDASINQAPTNDDLKSVGSDFLRIYRTSDPKVLPKSSNQMTGGNKIDRE